MTITKDNNPNPRFNRYYDIEDDVITEENVFHIGDHIGIGGNAVVYECIDRQGNIRAIKFLLNFSDKAQKRFKQEIEIMKKINHNHIVKYIDSGVISGKENRSKNMDDISIQFLIMERADKNIVDYMRYNNNSIDYEIYAPQFRGLANALQYLHRIAIHRDIKPENILVKGETWLLGDFGLCEMIDESQQLDITGDAERVGPKFWLSPEALDKLYFGQAEIDESSDVYQLCAVFWFIITRRYPIGVICDQDYASYDKAICQHILAALKYNKSIRVHNGRELYVRMCEATINSRGIN